MKPQFQSTFGANDGNCWAACIASLLELTTEDVPNFCVQHRKTWFVETERWLRKRGLTIIEFQIKSGIPDWQSQWIASGKSPRGDFHHSVLFQAEKLIHDPHPDGGGLNGGPKYGAVIVPVDLARWRYELTP